MKGTVPKRTGTVLKISVVGDGTRWTGRKPTRVIDFPYHKERWMLEETGQLVDKVLLVDGRRIKTQSRKYPPLPPLP